MTELQQEATSLDALAEIERQVLWLSTAIVHHANRVRPNPGGLKVGGHQASSASMVSIMTSLWFRHLRADDRVSVKPHASPVLHAINYLLGELDESYLPTLRAFGGLQSYPSRVKDPDPVDYSTGSVGIGATAPIWGAVARRYLNGRFVSDGAPGRQYSLLGDAELDEGAVWEAIVDPGVAELGEIVWVVDVNRQSLDRVVPMITADRLRGMFSAAGWQVITLKYGRLLEDLFARPGGEALRHRIDAMPNPEYQRLLRCHPDELRQRLPGGDESLARLAGDLDDAELARAIRNLGGHDLSSLDEAFGAIDDSRPTIILAYTIKGYGLAVEGHPQNHSALLTEAQLGELAAQLGTDPGEPWRRPAPDSAAGELCAQTARRLRRPAPPSQAPPAVPQDFGRTPAGVATTQAALGRTLLDLTREAPGGGRAGRHRQPGRQLEHQPGRLGEQGRRVVGRRTDRLVRRRRRDHLALAGEADRAAHRARHRRDQPGRPARRARRDLEPLGPAAAPDRGAVRPVRGASARAVVVRHLRGRPVDPGRHAVRGQPGPRGRGAPVHHHAVHRDRAAGLRRLRARVRGRHRVVPAGQPGPAGPAGRQLGLPAAVHPAGQPEAGRDPGRPRGQGTPPPPGGGRRVPAAPRRYWGLRGPGRDDRGDGRGRARGAGRRRTAGRGRDAGRRGVRDQPRAAVPRAARPPGRSWPGPFWSGPVGPGEPWILEQAFPAARATPLVTVLDGHPHTLSFLATVNRVPHAALGVAQFGQSGAIEDLYRYNGIDTDSIIRAALDLVP